ncbi:helix-turn-helix transcriptional regulator [Flavobacterium pallidum]|uniref:Transcriptional regulator n=1 Tax=Flavobacterium pallidum TaxID=2172098 RepID=A0A2S1SEW1_9FLAO|nr:YafY family protein [Flavobacterium pallidum]AWI24912.1 transcriptional regulator [Flavobacterium pallidum]
MYDESPKRFDRIIAILIQLQSRKIVRAQDLADRFEVSLRTIYRDIRTLEVSGVPIYSEAGIGYSLMDGYRLPPVMFTREEARSFIAAEKLMQQFTDKELGDHYAAAMYKLKAVLKSADKDLVTDMESKVLIRNSSPAFNQKAPNALASVFRSIGEKMQVVLLYEGIESNGPLERVVEPVGVFHENNNWYIFGYCHLRKDYRQFRTDRIHDIRITDDAFMLSHNALETYLKHNKEENLTKVVILVDKSIARYIKGDRRGYGFVSEIEKENEVEMTFKSRDPQHGFARWFMMFGDYATIVEPESLKVRIVELLTLSLSKLENN